MSSFLLFIIIFISLVYHHLPHPDIYLLHRFLGSLAIHSIIFNSHFLPFHVVCNACIRIIFISPLVPLFSVGHQTTSSLDLTPSLYSVCFFFSFILLFLLFCSFTTSSSPSSYILVFFHHRPPPPYFYGYSSLLHYLILFLLSSLFKLRLYYPSLPLSIFMLYSPVVSSLIFFFLSFSIFL